MATAKAVRCKWNKPVFGVTQAHLLFPCKNSTADGAAAPSGTTFSNLAAIFSGLGTPCLFLLVKLTLPILPVDARLQNESVEASEEQEAFNDKLEWSSSSCLLNTEEGALRDDFRVGDPETECSNSFFLSPSFFSSSFFFNGFEAGFRAADGDLVLFPAGPRTGLGSDSSDIRYRLQISPIPLAQLRNPRKCSALARDCCSNGKPDALD